MAQVESMEPADSRDRYAQEDPMSQASSLPPQVSPQGYGLGLDEQGYSESALSAQDAAVQHRLEASGPPYGASVEQYAPQRALSNSKSYAARAKARPDLSLDTKSPTKAYSEQDPLSSATLRTRGGSVSDRSPLQMLEMTLGEVSKEEKRARVAEAEQMAQERGTAKHLSTESASRQASQRRSQKESVPVSNQNRDDSTRSERESELLVFPTRTPRYDASHPLHIPQRQSLGYDSALTGAAAAAAVGAYEAKSRMRSGGPGPSWRDIKDYPQEQPAKSQSSEAGSEPAIQQTKKPRQVEFIQAPVQDAQPPPPQDQARDRGSAYTAEDNQESLGLSQLFHRGVYQLRHYQATKSLDEWKGADTVILTEDDLNLESREADSAWWERDASKSTSQGQNDRALDTDSHGGAFDHQAQQTTFQPKLLLRCGPLLRYIGLRKEGPAREFWRGTVLIVTRDDSSSYEIPPTLRIFKQTNPNDLAPSNGVNGETGQQMSMDRFDPIAGQHTMSRTGATLHVKSVHGLPKLTDLSRDETNTGLFEQRLRSSENSEESAHETLEDGEKSGLFREVRAVRLHAERGVTFWRFHLDVELSGQQSRIAYRINRGPTSSFWVPARGQSMNVMFHSCNGFSLTVDTNHFCGPDPLWRDVLNSHQNTPFHCMIGGGDQIYNDAAMRETRYFQDWLAIKNPERKHNTAFSVEMQEELESFYLNRYAMWFSQGLFAMAASQIPMVNVWDDHDIMDGFGSYPDHFMKTPVFSGLGAVAFKYYLLFQHQSVVDETTESEPSWILGARPGPYIHQLSRSVYVPLGNEIALFGLDCRTERKRDEILTQETWDIVFDRARREIIAGETKHLLVLLGIPIAYPRMNFAENILTSRVMDPIKALGRAGMLGGFVNRFDGGVEILDDLDDHWTAKHHKAERNWFILELQDLAAEKNVRVTILGGDVHLAAIGQFYTNKRQGIPKDRDHRYMPNIISSAIVNTPPPEVMADVLNRRNKVHHLDRDTDEDMVPLFMHDVDGKHRNNQRLLPRRNWCSIRDYEPGLTPPPTPPPEEPPKRRRSFSLSRSSSLSRSGSEKRSLLRRFSTRKAPPSSYQAPTTEGTDSQDHSGDGQQRYSTDDDRRDSSDFAGSENQESRGRLPFVRSGSFRKLSSSLSRRNSIKDKPTQEPLNLQGGLDVTFHCETYPGDPAGITTPYRFLVPALVSSGAQTAGMKTAAFTAHTNERGIDSGVGEADFDDLGDISPVGIEPDSQGYADIRASVDRETNRGVLNTVLPGGEDPSSSPQQSYRSALQVTDPDMENLDEQPNAQPLSSTRRYPPKPPPGEPTERTLQTLPRSEGPVETEMPYMGRSGSGRVGRWVLERRTSASGPPPPSNINQLPASVQKRYSQFVQGHDDQQYASTATASGSARNSSYATPTSSPLLPTNINQLRTSHRRTIQSDYDRERGSRSVSGGATTSTGYDSSYRNQANAENYGVPQRAATYHVPSTSQAKTSSAAPFRSPLTSAPNNGFVSPPPEHKEQMQRQKGPKDPYAFYDDEESPPQQPPLRRPSKFERHYGGFEGTYDPMAGKPKGYTTAYEKSGPLLPAPRPMIINPEKIQPIQYHQAGYGETTEQSQNQSAYRADPEVRHDERYQDQYEDEPREGMLSGLIRRLTDSGERRRKLQKTWR